MKIIIALLICFLLLFNSCSNKNQTQNIMESESFAEEESEINEDTNEILLDTNKNIYSEEITYKVLLENMTVKTHTITAIYQTDERTPYLNASIKFPQIYDMEDINIQNKVNELLREAVMDTVSYSRPDKRVRPFRFIENNILAEDWEIWEGENEYEIIYLCDNYISVNYHGKNFFGKNASTFSNYVTVDLNKCELIYFTESFPKESVIEAIKNMNFELIEGDFPDGLKENDPEIIDGFVEAVKGLSSWYEPNISYRCDGINNFAMDEQSIYIHFYFEDSLNGYVILRFSRKDLKERVRKEVCTEKITDKKSIGGIMLKTHTITASFNPSRMGDEAHLQRYGLHALIKFPQIYDMKDAYVQYKANQLLRDLAMQSINHSNYDETLKEFDSIVNKGVEVIWGGENEYKILHAGDDYISMNYNSIISDGNRVNIFSDYITIDLKNGEAISFKKYFSEDSIIEAIRALDFEVIEGHYMPGGWKGDEPEIIEGFVEAVKRAKEDSDFLYKFGTHNFAMDNQYVYICFYFSDSLNGYVILKFNRDDLT